MYSSLNFLKGGYIGDSIGSRVYGSESTLLKKRRGYIGKSDRGYKGGYWEFRLWLI